MNIDLSKYFDLEHLDKVKQQEFIGTLTDYVLARISDLVGEHLTEAEIVELESVGRNGDSSEVMSWLNNHIPNFSQGVDEIIAEERIMLTRNVEALTAIAA